MELQREVGSGTRKLVPKPQCQFTDSKSRVLRKRKVIYQMKRRIGRVTLSKLCCPTWERKCLPCKGGFRGLV
jgi:hypothetical protein